MVSTPSRHLVVASLIVLVRPRAVNRTVDDQNGDSVTGALPTYRPPDIWSQGATCVPCGVNHSNVDVSQTFDQTWHDTTYVPAVHGPEGVSIEIGFTGTAVYVYNLVANNILPTITFTNITFSVDGGKEKSFVHAADLSSTVETRVLVYKQESLLNTPHTLIMRAAGADESLVLFDYIEYTFDDSAPASVASTSIQGTKPVSGPTQSSAAPTTTVATSSATPSTPASDISLSTTPSTSISSSSIDQPNSTASPGSDTQTSVQSQTSPLPTSSSTDTSAARQAHSTLSAVAIGGITGGVIMFLFLGVLLAYYIHRRVRARGQSGVRNGSTMPSDTGGDFSIRDRSISTFGDTSYSYSDFESVTTRSLMTSAHATVGMHRPDSHAVAPRRPASRKSGRSHRQRTQSVPRPRQEDSEKREVPRTEGPPERRVWAAEKEKVVREEWEEWPRNREASGEKAEKNGDEVWETWREEPLSEKD